MEIKNEVNRFAARPTCAFFRPDRYQTPGETQAHQRRAKASFTGKKW